MSQFDRETEVQVTSRGRVCTARRLRRSSRTDSRSLAPGPGLHQRVGKEGEASPVSSSENTETRMGVAEVAPVGKRGWPLHRRPCRGLQEGKSQSRQESAKNPRA